MNQENTRAVNLHHEAYDIYIGRPSIWGNPFRVGEHGSRAEVIAKYRKYILGNVVLLGLLPTLRGKRLGCHCKPEACHGDVLAELADSGIGIDEQAHGTTDATQRRGQTHGGA